jgi:hypothetical protein
MRGPCWYPYFTSTTDGVHWTRPQTLLRGAIRSEGHKIRPYAKYSPGPGGSILMTFSDGHPDSYKTSLYYARYRAGRFYRANGRLIGTLGDLPFNKRQLDRVQAYSPTLGRPWPMDIAWRPQGYPVIVYSATVNGHDSFRYAHFDGRHWVTRLIAPAGGYLFGYRNGGISLDHADPRWMALTRLIDGAQEIEARFTPDDGSTFSAFQLTADSKVLNFRPVFPRGLRQKHQLVLVYVSGTATTFRNYRTVLRMRIDGALEPPPPAPPPPPPGPVPVLPAS